jgi:hypothetical protein
VTTDVYVKVSRVKEFNVTIKNHVIYTDLDVSDLKIIFCLIHL